MGKMGNYLPILMRNKMGNYLPIYNSLSINIIITN
jgi:hypothetical protein